MQKIIRIVIFVIFISICQSTISFSQELIVDFFINTDRINATDKDKFSSLNRELTELMNNTKFTDLNFSNRERIPIKFNLNILEQKDDRTYSAELLVQASRPVFGTSYTTSIFLYRDKDLNFTYDIGEQMTFDINNITNNLIASLSYYIYLTIYLNLDTFAQNGGAIVSKYIDTILSQAYSQSDWANWSISERDSKSNIYNALQSEEHNAFRNIFYQYHIKGLDLMESNKKEAMKNIYNLIDILISYKKEQFTSPLLSIFSDVKLEEIVSIFSIYPDNERMSLHKSLLDIYPTQSNKLAPLKIGEKSL